MKIISYAWTTEVLLLGLKWCSRRIWNDEYARRFYEGELCQAYDRSPRVGGRRVGIIRMTCAPYQEPLSAISDEEEKAEGGLWGSAEAFIDAFCKGANVDRDQVVWVIRFQLIDIEPYGLEYIQGRYAS